MHVEQNHRTIAHLIQNPDIDYWYWNRFYSETSTSNMPFWVDSISPTGNLAQVKMKFMGGATLNISGEHHPVLTLNGTIIAEGSWQGIEPYTLTSSFPASLLSNGWNTLNLSGILPEGALYSLMYWDWFDISYDRYYISQSNMLYCPSSGISGITAAEFTSTNILVWDVTSPTMPQSLTPSIHPDDDSTWQATFSTTSNAIYMLTETSAVKNTTNVTPVKRTAPFMNSTNQVDWLVITRNDFTESLAPLVSHRQSQGLRCRIVDIADIFNTFSYGISTPYAIRDFLTFCHSQWQTPPTYVLLAGQGSRDYKNYVSIGDNIIPTILTYNPSFIATSDNWLADINEDGIPEFAVGRFPANTTTKLETMVNKVLAYEIGTQENNWSNTIIMAADTPDEAGDFTASSELVATYIPSGKRVEKIYLSEMDTITARTNLLSTLREGALFFNYIGHASYTKLSSERLFQNSDISTLTNKVAMPVMLGMTCYINNFSYPNIIYIGCRMVLQLDGGMIASWAPSGSSFNNLAIPINQRFLFHYFNGTSKRIGNIIINAFTDYIADGNPSYEPRQFVLLGDPALLLK